MTAQEAYTQLVARARNCRAGVYRRRARLGRAHLYAPKARTSDPKQEWLAGVAHEKFTDPNRRVAVDCRGSDMVKDPDSPESANIREWRHAYDKATKLPKSLVEEFAKTTSLAQGKWPRPGRTGTSRPSSRGWRRWSSS